LAVWLRTRGTPLIRVANTAEGRAGELGVAESYRLGLGDPVQISAEHGEGMADLFEAHGDDGLSPVAHDHSADLTADFSEGFADDLASALDAAARDGNFDNRFESGLDKPFDGDDADPRDQADSHPGARTPEDAPGRAGSEAIEGAMAAWALLRGSGGSGRSMEGMFPLV
jgi:hypothetical protein